MLDVEPFRKENILIDQSITRLAVALAIGLLIGLERGWSARSENEGERAAGLRTHAISGLLGGVAALVGQLTTPFLLGFVFVGFAGVTAIFHWMESRDEHDFSATGAIAGMMAFLLGAYAVLGSPELASTAATATVVLLALKRSIHGWLKRLEWLEIRAGLILITMTFLFLPLLPDKTVDPWGAINPARVWELAILVCTLSFIGYAAIRIFGERNGIILAAISGGLVSSTAATLNFARLAKTNPSQSGLMAGSIALAGAVMSARILVIVAIVNLDLISTLSPILGIAALVQGAIGVLMIVSGTANRDQSFRWKNPFDLASALQFACLMAFIMLLSTLAARYLGESGLLGLSALSGLADVDAITLSLARVQEPAIAPQLAINGILLAATVNTAVKCAIAGYAGGSEIGWRASLAGIASLAAAGAVLLLTRV
jgi:uncharacterized membrane protein (DUF4010 family)